MLILHVSLFLLRIEAFSIAIGFIRTVGNNPLQLKRRVSNTSSSPQICNKMKKLSGCSAYTHATQESDGNSKGSASARSLLSSEDIKKFQALYKEHYGREISKEEALDQGLKLLTLMRCIYKPMTAEERDRTDELRAERAGDLITYLDVK